LALLTQLEERRLIGEKVVSIPWIGDILRLENPYIKGCCA
jgi:hypothetical protein